MAMSELDGLVEWGVTEDSSVLVSSNGSRFHRPNGLGFPTACKTKFGRTPRELTLKGVIEAGYSPWTRSESFGSFDSTSDIFVLNRFALPSTACRDRLTICRYTIAEFSAPIDRGDSATERPAEWGPPQEIKRVTGKPRGLRPADPREFARDSFRGCHPTVGSWSATTSPRDLGKYRRNRRVRVGRRWGGGSLRDHR